MVDIFDAKEIGQALGRDNTVHGVVASGGIASRLITVSYTHLTLPTN